MSWTQFSYPKLQKPGKAWQKKRLYIFTGSAYLVAVRTWLNVFQPMQLIELWLSTCGLWPHTEVVYNIPCISDICLTTVVNYSYRVTKIKLWLGGHHNMRNWIKGSRNRKVENTVIEHTHLFPTQLARWQEYLRINVSINYVQSLLLNIITKKYNSVAFPWAQVTHNISFV